MTAGEKPGLLPRTAGYNDDESLEPPRVGGWWVTHAEVPPEGDANREENRETQGLLPEVSER